MRKNLNKNLLWSLIIILTVLGCKKPVETNPKSEFVIVRDTTKIEKSSRVKAFNLETIVSTIPDSIAREYISKYNEQFPEDDKFPKVFIMGKKSYDTILNSRNPNKLCKILFIEKDGTLNLVYQDGNDKEMIFHSNGYMKIEDTAFDNMNRRFEQNLYSIMNSRITTLGGSTTALYNTKKVNIPLAEFEAFNLQNSRDFILLFPAIITRDTDTSKGLGNQKNHLTLIVGVWRFDGVSLKFQSLSRLYDNFCVSPPNNC